MTTERKFGEYAVAATAFFVSVCSLFIYIYQSKLMAEQQQVAVWPYVQWATSNIDGYQLTAYNKGVGPALIRKVEMRFNGQLVKNNRELINAVLGAAGADYSVRNSALLGNVLSPNESITFLSLVDKAEGRAFEAKLREGKFELDVTYCSIYGRCWITSGFAGKRTEDDQSIDY